MKGISQFLAATLIILITVGVSIIVANFIISTAQERSSTVANVTKQRLQCQFADLFIKNVTFDCNSNCFVGVPHRVNATIENIGTIAIELSNIITRMNTGEEYTIPGSRTGQSAATVETKNFNSILISSSPVMPIETMDTRRAYANDSNTVALWHFDEGSGQDVKDSARNNTGSLGSSTSAEANDPAWNTSANCKFSTCLSFNGTTFVTISYNNNSNITGDKLTLEAWVYRTTSAGNRIIISKINGTGGFVYYLRLFGTNAVEFAVNNGTLATTDSSSVTLSINMWHHVAGVYNGTEIKVFVDGSLSGTPTTLIGNISNTANPIYIGSNGTGSSANRNFTGSIDEVRISNISRSFNTTLSYTISHPNLKTVRIYNSTATLLRTNSTSGGSFSDNFLVDTPSEYRIEVEDTSGNKIDKWYPIKPDASLCTATSNLEKVIVVAQNCPQIFDAVTSGDVNFVNCV